MGLFLPTLSQHQGRCNLLTPPDAHRATFCFGGSSGLMASTRCNNFVCVVNIDFLASRKHLLFIFCDLLRFHVVVSWGISAETISHVFNGDFSFKTIAPEMSVSRGEMPGSAEQPHHPSRGPAAIHRRGEGRMVRGPCPTADGR